MSRPEKLKIADSRPDSANRPDLCKVLKQELKPLYLLAFLLTASHWRMSGDPLYNFIIDGDFPACWASSTAANSSVR
jgi:hypothetical protein